MCGSDSGREFIAVNRAGVATEESSTNRMTGLLQLGQKTESFAITDIVRACENRSIPIPLKGVTGEAQ